MALIARKTGGQFLRFFVVGVGATLVHLLVYWSLNAAFGLTEEDAFALVVTLTFGYMVSFIGNFIVSLKWTFRTQGSVKKGAGFALSHLVNWGMQVGLLELFRVLGVGGVLAWCMHAFLPWVVALFPELGNPASLLLLPVFCVVVPINFLLVRFFLTRGDAPTTKSAPCQKRLD